MKKAILSEAEKKRLERYAFLKKEFLRLTKDGSLKTEVIKVMAKEHKVSSATIYKALS